MAWEHQSQHQTREQRPGALTGDVRDNEVSWEFSGDPKTDAHRGIQMATRDIPEGIDQRQDDQSKGHCDPGMSDRSIALVVDNDGTGAAKDQSETTERFGKQSSRSIGELEWYVQHEPFSLQVRSTVR
jgi:hypothetical protein